MRSIRQHDAGVPYDLPAKLSDGTLITLDGTETCWLLLESPDGARRKRLPAIAVTGANVVRRVLETEDFDQWKTWQTQGEIVKGGVHIHTAIVLCDVDRVLMPIRIFSLESVRVVVRLPQPSMS